MPCTASVNCHLLQSGIQIPLTSLPHSTAVGHRTSGSSQSTVREVAEKVLIEQPVKYSTSNQQITSAQTRSVVSQQDVIQTMQTQQTTAAQQSYSILGQNGPGKPKGNGRLAPAVVGQDHSTGALQQATPRNLDLSVGIKLEFFAAMKRAAFGKRNHNNLRDLIGHEMRRRNMQGKSGKVALIHVPTEEELDSATGSGTEFPAGSWRVTRDTFIDPDHPEWFDDCELLPSCPFSLTQLSSNSGTDELQPIKIITPPYLGFGQWPEFESDVRTLLGTVKGEDDDEADLYCELNTSTHFHVEIGNAAGDGGFDLETVKRLAILVLCFEKEIDKMLADHMGYIYESVSEIN